MSKSASKIARELDKNVSSARNLRIMATFMKLWLKLPKMSEDKRSERQVLVDELEDEAKRYDTSISMLEPAKLVRPRRGILKHVNKLLSPIPKDTVMGRQAKANESGFSKLHSRAFKMVALTIAILAAAHFLLPDIAFNGLYYVLEDLLKNWGLDDWVTLLGIPLAYSAGYWGRMIGEQDGATYQKWHMYLTQLFFTGSQDWSGKQTWKAGLAAVLVYWLPIFVMYPILSIVVVVAFSQLLALYRSEYRVYGDSHLAARTTAVTYRTYELSLVVILFAVFFANIAIGIIF